MTPDFRRSVLSNFKCQQSGNCCKCPGVVYVEPTDIENMAKISGDSVSEFRKEYVVKHKGWDVIATRTHRTNCFLDDKNRCQVYEARPKACRTYPDWDMLWENEDDLKAECKLCPALKKAVEDTNKTFK